MVFQCLLSYKGNNKITEFRTILLKENCENRNDPNLVQAFLKKRWIESDFRGDAFLFFLY